MPRISKGFGYDGKTLALAI